MALISLGAITLIAMMLWVFVSVISAFRPVRHAKEGLAVMYVTAVVWSLGVI